MPSRQRQTVLDPRKIIRRAILHTDVRLRALDLTNFDGLDELGDDEEWDDGSRALLQAMAEWCERDEASRASWDPLKHKRYPKGHPLGGKFRPMVDQILDAFTAWQKAGGKGDPFKGFDREQLRKVALKRGITLKHGAPRDDIAKLLKADLTKSTSPGPQADKDEVPILENGPDMGAWLKPGTASKPKKATPKATAAAVAVAAGGHVTTQPFPGGPFAGNKTSLMVEVDGLHIGAVHQDADGRWTAKALGSKADHFTPPPPSATKSQAIQSVVDAHLASVKATPKKATAVPKTKVAGVTLHTKPKISGNSPSHYKVEYKGVHIGNVHGDDQDPNVEWVAFKPFGEAWTVQDPGGKPTRDDAIKELVKSYKAHLAKTGAAPTKVPAEPAPKVPAAIRAGDFSGLKRVGPTSGTTPGGVFEAPDGSRWYVKGQQSPEHARNEALASALYRTAGIDVPEVIQGKGTPDLPGESHTATRMVDNAKANLAQAVSDGDEAYLAEIRQGFAVDAWLANWDVVGEGSESPWGNIVEGADGKPHRIDVGGALLFRGKGGPKGDKFGERAVEFGTMRDASKGRRHVQVFAGITDDQLAESVERVKAITPAKIRKLVADHGMDTDLADLLLARRKDLLSQANIKPKVLKGWDGAATATVALKAAPVTVGDWGETPRAALEKLGLPPDVALIAAGGFYDYKDGEYGLMNRALLKAEGGKLDVNILGPDGIAKLRAMDEAMQLSRLDRDVIVYRGERAPARNFPPGVWSLTGGMEGLEWTFHAYGSSSTDRTVADAFARTDSQAPQEQRQPTVMRILVPKGTHAVNLGGTDSSEDELLLGRGLKYRVVKDHGVQSGIRNIDVEVVP